MTARKTTKKKAAKKKTARKSSRGVRSGADAIDSALASLEKEIPRLVRQLRGNLRDLEKQAEKARRDGEKRLVEDPQLLQSCQ